MGKSKLNLTDEKHIARLPESFRSEVSESLLECRALCIPVWYRYVPSDKLCNGETLNHWIVLSMGLFGPISIQLDNPLQIAPVFTELAQLVKLARASGLFSRSSDTYICHFAFKAVKQHDPSYLWRFARG